MKWLWKYSQEPQSLWSTMIKAKYGVVDNWKTNPVIIWYQPLEVYQFPKLPKCDQTPTPYQIVENRTKDNFLKITLDSLSVKHFSSYLTHKLQNRSLVGALRRAS